ncbi:anhydro-N-acetylmuramic acid kinase [Winogradskyella sp. PE311]|uniref:anhydro-N-acetylmuramic acid kinase n=1 Tax=Winogradskyella sp. PE311 TaxID=3366943 RepID=UPI00398045DE
MIKSNFNVIGVMSGTSLDGIDIIYAEFKFDNQWTFVIHNAETIKYSKKWKSILKELVNRSRLELDNIDAEYSIYLATVILNFLKENQIEAIDFISSHGHTALHQPENGLTLQIGNKQILAEVLNLKVICDFRIQDVQYGGQGAPLVPIGDRLLFSHYDYCLNLGGFANISFENKKNRIAYDICPVNIVLNHYAAKLGMEYDDKGKIALSGKVRNELLIKLNELNFYTESPPKSLGLEWVELNIFPLINSFNLQVEDILSTFIEHIAIQVSKVLYKKHTNVLITGGGAYNKFLIERLNIYSPCHIIIPTKEIIEFKEALVFGLLGVLKEINEVNCLQSVTGAIKDHSSGKILIPKNHV